MRKLLRSIASLKLAVVLLVLLLVGLAAGTILESAHGTDEAGRLVYYSWWFLGLQGVFAANVIASIALHFPWGKNRVGFLTTHSALIVILIGASVTYFFKQETQLQIWEGETNTQLGFPVKLNKFTIDHYPGTMRPSNFRSDVEVDGRPAAVWMNHELLHNGWRFYQSSYQQEPGRSATVLSVSKDPGQNIVFIGYGLLVAGMCIVIATRAAGVRAARERRLTTPKDVKKVAAIAAMFALAALPARAGVEELRRLPVQHDGRVMPLDTLAREAVWNVTGQTSWNGSDPVQSVAFWWSEPDVAIDAPIVKITPDLAALSRLPPGTTHASFAQLVNDKGVLAMMDEARAQEGAKQGVVASAAKLEERLLWMQKFLQHDGIRPIPAEGRWQVSKEPLETVASGPRLEGWPSQSSISQEILYNAARPTRIAWIVLFAALILSLLGRHKLSLAGLVAGFLVMTWGIATRWQIADRIPAANMYESLLFLAWGVGLFAVIAFAVMKNKLLVQNANAMAALTMALTDLLPIDGFVHPVPPVLAGTPWLAIHVPIIMVSYSVLALGVVVAHMQLGLGIFAPARRESIARMNDLLYWYMLVGSTLLVTGILTGSIWASSSWGRYWGWDPKEVWSLVAFLAYVAILHARWEKMIGPFGVAAISIVAFQTILMTYLGVNFVLTTGLHSYGMGDSPVVTWMVIVAGAEAAFVGAAWAAQRRTATVAAASPA